MAHNKKASIDKTKVQHMDTYTKLMQIMNEKNQLNPHRVKSTDKSSRLGQLSSSKKPSIHDNKIKTGGSKSREKSLGSVNPTYILKNKNSRNAQQNGIVSRMNTKLGSSNN